MDQDNSTENQSTLSPRTLSLVSWASGLIWLILGSLLIMLFHQHTIPEVLLSGQDIIIQLSAGILSGILFGWIGISMLDHDSLKKTLEDYTIIQILKNTPLSKGLILQISIIAGITEEFLFRGAMQPLLGIWLTSVIFIAVHGYIRFKTFHHVLFTLFTFALSMMLGYLFIFFGLISAIIAHIVYDYLLLSKMMHQNSNNPE